MAEVLDRCIKYHQPRAQKKGIQLEVKAPDVVIVYAESEGIRQIMDNLIDNAIKYSLEDGLVQIFIKIENKQVILRVHDNGLGISEEHMERIFERFYRVDKARSRELGGTGLGLSIVKHLVNAFGGTVEVNSHPDKGTAFIVTLPLAESSPAVATSS